MRLTRAQVREIDHRASEIYHVPGIVLMENAALAAAEVACEMLDHNCTGEVLVLCGGGNNGGDGLAAARHLHNRGAEVTLVLTVAPDAYRGDALVNWHIVQAMKLPVVAAESAAIERMRPLLIIDAMFGTGLTQAPREPFAAIVEAVRKTHAPVLAIDLPSGLDCDTGLPLGAACMAARRTITLVAEKAGFANPQSRQYTGEVTVGDIGCPRELIYEVAQAL